MQGVGGIGSNNGNKRIEPTGQNQGPSKTAAPPKNPLEAMDRAMGAPKVHPAPEKAAPAEAPFIDIKTLLKLLSGLSKADRAMVEALIAAHIDTGKVPLDAIDPKLRFFLLFLIEKGGLPLSDAGFILEKMLFINLKDPNAADQAALRQHLAKVNLKNNESILQKDISSPSVILLQRALLWNRTDALLNKIKDNLHEYAKGWNNFSPAETNELFKFVGRLSKRLEVADKAKALSEILEPLIKFRAGEINFGTALDELKKMLQSYVHTPELLHVLKTADLLELRALNMDLRNVNLPAIEQQVNFLYAVLNPLSEGKMLKMLVFDGLKFAQGLVIDSQMLNNWLRDNMIYDITKSARSLFNKALGYGVASDTAFFCALALVWGGIFFGIDAFSAPEQRLGAGTIGVLTGALAVVSSIVACFARTKNL